LQTIIPILARVLITNTTIKYRRIFSSPLGVINYISLSITET